MKFLSSIRPDKKTKLPILKSFFVALFSALLILVFTQISSYREKQLHAQTENKNQYKSGKENKNQHAMEKVYFLFYDDEVLIKDESQIKSEKNGKITKFFFPNESVMIHGKGKLGYDIPIVLSHQTVGTEEWQEELKKEIKIDKRQGVQLHQLTPPPLSMHTAHTLFREEKPIQISQVKYPLLVSEFGTWQISPTEQLESKSFGPVVFSVSFWNFNGKKFPQIHLKYDGGNEDAAKKAKEVLRDYLLHLDEETQAKFYAKGYTTVSLYLGDVKNKPREDVCEQWDPVPSSIAIFTSTTGKKD